MPEKKSAETAKSPTAKVMFNVLDHDISDAGEEGVWIDIQDPKTGKPTGFQVLVAHEDSSHVKKARNKVAGRLQFQQRRSSRRKMTMDDLEEGDLIIALGASLDWRTIDTDEKWQYICPHGDELLKFTSENCRRVYEAAPFIPRQVLDSMDDWALFTGN
jgi:hypothetical protein